ncbi:hypothetical protein O9H85_11965 [Paenibacillus filicis]|uniref:Uncharacterized protein n=1 Tax=Paenibacillus gyeongsangnamensis TaxID=3388067 RepID=A0ABT4Q8K8_9BACL|nr:hypothetical protein [Paenibacillus filicis]MCZ8513126.1 hypothetical protein [Paenibacillus filicis]
MDFTSHDIAVIEQALQIAIREQDSESKAGPFQEVLSKLKVNAAAAMHQTSSEGGAGLDGFRYDYDDSSDLH